MSRLLRGSIVAATVLIAAPIIAAAQAPVASDEQLLLESNGLDQALFDRFAAGKAAADDDRSAQLAVFTGLRLVTQLELDRYAQSPTSPQELGDAGRGRLWHVRGKLKSITPIDLTDDEWSKLYAELDELKSDDPRRRLYRCEVALVAGGPPATIVSMRIPSQLVGRDNLDERIGVQGLLVKNAGTAEAPHPVLYARRLAWYPHNYLGDLGMDYALFDDVRREAHDLKQERECFYQLLATMRKADFTRLLNEPFANRDPKSGELSIVPLFNDPLSMRGKLVELVGTARRAVAVVVNDADIQERFGIKQYHEVSIYTADSQQNPLIFNLLELPPDFPEGEDIHATVRIPGTLLTGFYYHRDATPDEQAQGIKPKPQKAPLLIGKTLQYVPPPVVNDDMYEWLFGASVVAAFVALIVGVWRMMRGERKSRALRQRQMAPPTGTSLNDVNVEYQARPDFNGIDVPAPPGEDGSPS